MSKLIGWIEKVQDNMIEENIVFLKELNNIQILFYKYDKLSDKFIKIEKNTEAILGNDFANLKFYIANGMFDEWNIDFLKISKKINSNCTLNEFMNKIKKYINEDDMIGIKILNYLQPYTENTIQKVSLIGWIEDTFGNMMIFYKTKDDELKTDLTEKFMNVFIKDDILYLNPNEQYHFYLIHIQSNNLVQDIQFLKEKSLNEVTLEQFLNTTNLTEDFLTYDLLIQLLQEKNISTFEVVRQFKLI